MILLCDNTIAIKTANNLVQYDRTKHTVLDKNYIKENEDVGVILIPYNKNTNQLVDIMTQMLQGLFKFYYPSWTRVISMFQLERKS